MSSRNKLAGDIEESIGDPVTAAALENFKSSMNAWSQAEYSRPRTTVRAVGHAGASWRLAAAWVIACMLAAGSLVGGLYERHQRQEQAAIKSRIATAKATQQKTAQKLDLTNKAPEQRVAASIVVTKRRPSAVKSAAANDAELLATVDSDVSRQVPAAMEPLAQMMDSSDGAN